MEAPAPRRDVHNRILTALGDESFAFVWERVEHVTLKTKQILNEAGSAPEHLYFPNGGVIAFAYDLPSGRTAEFGVVGREGVSSFSVLKHFRVSPVRTVVLVGGSSAYRIESEALRQAFRQYEDLRDGIYEFLYAFMGQMAYTAMSNGSHTLIERIARWLLLCDDRLDGANIPVTHELFAATLTSQRTSVTSALHVIEGQGAIRNTRGRIHVVDRQRLEAIAGEAYLRYGEVMKRYRTSA